MEKFTFFWNGPFSQWEINDFTVDGHTYNCCEKFMMAEKARLFGDEETLAKIIACYVPADQKALGRLVNGFNEEIWNKHAKSIVYRGNYAKFTQNETLRKFLMDTKGTTLVEASPYDRIWGIGLRANDMRALDRHSWQGTNWLGEVLTKLREDLIAEGKSNENP